MPLDIKSIALDGLFEGYASLFNKEDLGHDIVLPGAFRDSLAERGPDGVKMLFQHDPDAADRRVDEDRTRTRAACSCAAG